MQRGRVGVLRGQPVVQRKHRQARAQGEPGRERAVRGGRANAIGAAMQIQHCAQRRVGVLFTLRPGAFAQPLARHTACLARRDRDRSGYRQ